MTNMFSSMEWIAIFVGLLWLSALSFFLLKMRAHYNSLTDGVSKKNLQEILDALLKDIHSAKKDLAVLMNRYVTIEKEGQVHIQKIGLLRFNPFKDTGGDQSFIVALLDANDSGIVVSGLYSRSGTRWYAKRVVRGKGADHELSDEEVKAITNAKSANG